MWSNDHRTRAGVRPERNPKRLSGETHNKAAFSLPLHTVCIGSDSKQLSHGDFVP